MPGSGERRASLLPVAAAIATPVTTARQDPLQSPKTTAAATSTTALPDRQHRRQFQRDPFQLAGRKIPELASNLALPVSTPRMALASTVPSADTGTRLLRPDQLVPEPALLDTIARGVLVLRPTVTKK